RATARKLILPRASSASAGPIPRSHQIRLAERDRSATSLGGKQQKPSRNSAKAHPPPSLLSECRTDPAEPPNTPSGAGSVRNEPWRRTAKTLAQQRESLILPRASSASAGPIPRSHQIRLAERERSATSLGGEQQTSSRNSAKAPPPPSLLSECRTDPAERRSIHSAPSKYRCNHSKIVACHSRLFCGFSTQCPSSGKYNNRLGTP
ncbi:MAG: hypothetical protein RLZZ582_1864, partial [Verrucomicrobiota bacterium]